MAKQSSRQHISCTGNVSRYTCPSSGGVIFTGPRGLRDYRPHSAAHVQAVGIGAVSAEQTLDIDYLFRSAPGATLVRPRNLIPGEIGWGIPWLADGRLRKTGHEIVLGEFRQAAEDKLMHENVAAWYPCPVDKTPQCSDGHKRKNIYNGELDIETDEEMVPMMLKYASQDGLQPEVLSNGRFRPLEATQHLDMYRNC